VDPPDLWRIASTTLDSAVCHRRMDLDDFMAALDDEEPNVSSDYHPDRFDRRQNNRALNKLATGSYEEALDEIHHQSVDRIPRRVATQRPDPDERRHFEAVYGRLGLRIIEATGETDHGTPLIRGRCDIALNEIIDFRTQLYRSIHVLLARWKRLPPPSSPSD